MKRILCYLFSVVFALLVFPNSVFGAESRYRVGADSISVQRDDSVTVPVSISNNDGIMGFRLKIKYPDATLDLQNISSGSVTKTGLFNTTVTDYAKTNGCFDILWSNNTEVASDGTLAILSFKVRDSAKQGEHRIALDYSQEDTFDGGFNGVPFHCVPITVMVGGQTDASQTQAQSSNTNEKSGGESVSADFLANTVNEALYAMGGKDFSELTAAQQEQLLDEVNGKIVMYDKNARQYDDFDELCSDYTAMAKSEAVRKVMESTDDSDIKDVINKVLSEYGVKRFRDIPKEQLQKAVEKVKTELSNKGADVSGFEKVSDEEALEVIDELSKQADQQSRQGELTANSGKGSTVGIGHKAILVIALCLAASAFGILFYVINIKRRANNEKNK